MVLSKIFARKPQKTSGLYGAIVAAARREKFYAEWDVPDTLDGRFDMVVLHMFLVLDRLKGGNERFRQQLTDMFFSDLDRTLREMGVGDLSVSKKIRPMAEAFTGRMKAYLLAMDQGDDALLEALWRNVYAGENNPKARLLGSWMNENKANLLATPTEQLLIGELNFA